MSERGTKRYVCVRVCACLCEKRIPKHTGVEKSTICNDITGVV